MMSLTVVKTKLILVLLTKIFNTYSIVQAYQMESMAFKINFNKILTL